MLWLIGTAQELKRGNRIQLADKRPRKDPWFEVTNAKVVYGDGKRVLLRLRGEKELLTLDAEDTVRIMG